MYLSPIFVSGAGDGPAPERMIETDVSGRIGPVTATMPTVQQASVIVPGPLRGVVE